MKLKFLLLFLLFINLISLNIEAFYFHKSYKNGKNVCLENKSLRSKEIFKWVQVPIDYNNQQDGKTLIYSYTIKKFNKNLPSIIYFTGGPGSSPRGNEFDLPNTNIIFFEQRGIGCSRPETEILFKDKHFYSSVNTAKDAEVIMKEYGIKSITSYGQSYGTIPATIFASIFPNKVNNLILEGVIYHGDNTLWNSERKRYLIQKFYNELSSSDQEIIKEITLSNKVPKSWFSKLAGMILYLNNNEETFKNFFNGLLLMEHDSLINFINNFYPSEKAEEEFSFGDVMMGMIGCQEISMSNPNLSFNLIQNENGQFEYDQNNIDNKERCIPLGIKTAPEIFYKAEKYPVNVPTFYLLGENDGATDLDQGLSHFKNVPKYFKQGLIMKSGGHMPSLSLLKDRIQCHKNEKCIKNQNDLMSVIFENIVHHSSIEKDLIIEFNKLGPLNFSFIQ